MTESAEPGPYAPQRRTALVLTGTGTAGAYHAGVLRALDEAGVKLDIVAGRGIGAVSALFAAIDGGQSLWSDKGFWQSAGVKTLYAWRPALRLAFWAVVLAVLIVAVPLAAIAAGALVFPIDFVVRMVGLGGAGGLTGAYLALTQQLFAPDGFPTWLPRLVVLVLGTAALIEVMRTVLSEKRRRQRGPFWWRGVGSPLSSREAVAHSWRSLWDLLRGAAALRQPTPADLARRYVDLLADNIGQPGFRELLVAVHDLDAHRDLVFALVAEPRRRDLSGGSSTRPQRRGAQKCSISRARGRSHLADAVAASLACRSPRIRTRDVCARRLLARRDPPRVRQARQPDADPRGAGRSRRRAGGPRVGVARAARPHALAAGRLDGKGRLERILQSSEAAAVRDATRLVATRTPRMATFTIRPGHNPIGPFDFSGEYSDQSDRRQPLTELMGRDIRMPTTSSSSRWSARAAGTAGAGM